MSGIFGSDRSFEATLNGTDQRVIVGGKDISAAVHSIEVTAEAGRSPYVRLYLPVLETTRIESERTEVAMNPAIRALLIEAGWKPPPAEAGDPS